MSIAVQKMANIVTVGGFRADWKLRRGSISYTSHFSMFEKGEIDECDNFIDKRDVITHERELSPMARIQSKRRWIRSKFFFSTKTFQVSLVFYAFLTTSFSNTHSENVKAGGCAGYCLGAEWSSSL